MDIASVSACVGNILCNIYLPNSYNLLTHQHSEKSSKPSELTFFIYPSIKCNPIRTIFVYVTVFER